VGGKIPLLSIAFIALLAEKHNIWGPFLIVVVDSSEFHRWRQEVATLAPIFKVQLWCGTDADIEVLESSWEGMHSAYIENLPFYVMVTSYRAVMIYNVYIQGIRWKCVALDDIEAISNHEIFKEALSYFSNTKSLYLETTRSQVDQPSANRNAKGYLNTGVARKRKSQSIRISYGRVDGLEHLCKFVPATNLPSARLILINSTCAGNCK
jgi:hypothetical protein